DFSRFQIDKPQNDRRRAKVHGQSMKGPGTDRDLLSIQENPLAVSRHGRIEFPGPTAHRQLKSMPLDPHLPTAHCMTMHCAALRDYPATARQAKIIAQMLLC